MPNVRDITGDIGPLYQYPEKPKYRMNSFNRAAYIFWQGFYNGLRKKGLTHQQAIDEMQSKGTRWMLDAKDDQVQALGEQMAADYKPILLKNE